MVFKWIAIVKYMSKSCLENIYFTWLRSRNKSAEIYPLSSDQTVFNQLY